FRGLRVLARPSPLVVQARLFIGGAEGDRTPDLMTASPRQHEHGRTSANKGVTISDQSPSNEARKFMLVRRWLAGCVDRCVDMNKSYVKKRGKIYARISYRDSQGKRRQIWRKVENKSAAKDKVVELAQELDEFGVEAFEHDLTLGKYLDRWLKSVKQ